MKKLILILFMLPLLIQAQNWIVPGDTIITRNVKITGFSSTTNDSRSIRVGNNGAIMLDSNYYSRIPTISSFIEKSRTCSSLRDDKDAFARAFAATDNLIIDNGCYYINSTLTIPAGKTLIFEPGGKIEGTGTIVMNETKIKAGLSQIFDTTLSFSGTANVKEVYPEWLGAKGDSITNDYKAFDKAIEFTKLTTSKKLKLQGVKYTINNYIDITGLNLSGSGISSTVIYTKYSGQFIRSFESSNIEANTATSINNITKTLIKDAYKHSNYIEVTNTTILSSLNAGDYVLIGDTTVVGSGTPGEIKIIRNISGSKIYFGEPLFDSYLQSENAFITKLNLSSIMIDGMSIINNNRSLVNTNDVAITLEFVKNTIISNVFIDGFNYASIAIIGGYNVIIENCDLNNNINTETGYNVYINGVVHTNIDGVVGAAARHNVTDGGSSILHGVAWDLRISDCHFSYYNNTNCSIDSHPASGSIYVSNCIIDNIYTDATLWDAAVAYSTGDYVLKSNVLYKAISNSTGQDPDTVSLSYWRTSTYNASSAFKIRGGSMYIDGCIVNGFAYIAGNGYTFNGDDFVMKNVYAKNCGTILKVSNSDTLRNIVLENITINNDYAINQYSYGLFYLNDDFYNKNLLVNNIFLINTGNILYITYKIRDNINISNLKVYCNSDRGQSNSIFNNSQTNIHINKFYIFDTICSSVIISDYSSGTYINNIDGVTSRHFYRPYKDTINLSINGNLKVYNNIGKSYYNLIYEITSGNHMTADVDMNITNEDGGLIYLAYPNSSFKLLKMSVTGIYSPELNNTYDKRMNGITVYKTDTLFNGTANTGKLSMRNDTLFFWNGSAWKSIQLDP